MGLCHVSDVYPERGEDLRKLRRAVFSTDDISDILVGVVERCEAGWA